MSAATETLLFLANYNSWRRGDKTIEMPSPAKIGATIDDAVTLSFAAGHNTVCPNFARTLERELAAEREKVRTLREALGRIEDAADKHSFGGDMLAWAGDVATAALAIAATKEGAK